MAPTKHSGRRGRPADQPLLEGAPEPDHPRKGICGARRASGGLCQRKPGSGTDHPGVGRCAIHGGLAPTGKKAAGVIIGQGMILDGKKIMGVPIEISPAEALAQCVYIAAGEVAYCTMRIEQLHEEEVVQRESSITATYVIEGYEDMTPQQRKQARAKARRHGGRSVGRVLDEVKITRGQPLLHLWIRERQRCVDRLARLSKMALDAGVAEREVALQERMAGILVQFAQGLMEGLGLTAKQRAAAPAVVQGQLIALAGGIGDRKGEEDAA